METRLRKLLTFEMNSDGQAIQVVGLWLLLMQGVFLGQYTPEAY
jgi:hypothetical protein